MSNNMDLPPVSHSDSSSPQPVKPAPLKSAMKKVSDVNRNERDSRSESLNGKVSLNTANSKAKVSDVSERVLSKEEIKKMRAERVGTANKELENERNEYANKSTKSELTWAEGTLEKTGGKTEKELKKKKSASREEVSKWQEVRDDLIFYKVLHSGRAVINEKEMLYKDPVTTEEEANKLLENKDNGAFLVRLTNDNREDVLVLSMKKELDGKSSFKHVEFKIEEDGSIKEINGQIHPSFSDFLKANQTSMKNRVEENIDVASFKSKNEDARQANLSNKDLKKRSVSVLEHLISALKSIGVGISYLAGNAQKVADRFFSNRSLEETANKVYNRKTMTGIDLSQNESKITDAANSRLKKKE